MSGRDPTLQASEPRPRARAPARPRPRARALRGAVLSVCARGRGRQAEVAELFSGRCSAAASRARHASAPSSAAPVPAAPGSTLTCLRGRIRYDPLLEVLGAMTAKQALTRPEAQAALAALKRC